MPRKAIEQKCVKLFEALIGNTLENFIIKAETLNITLFEDSISDIKNIDIQKHCECCNDNEIVISLNENDDISNFCDELECTHQHILDFAEELIRQSIKGLSLEYALDKHYIYFNTWKNSFEVKKYKKILNLAKCIIFFSKENEINENHISLAKTNKNLMESIMINQKQV